MSFADVLDQIVVHPPDPDVPGPRAVIGHIGEFIAIGVALVAVGGWFGGLFKKKPQLEPVVPPKREYNLVSYELGAGRIITAVPV